MGFINQHTTNSDYSYWGVLSHGGSPIVGWFHEKSENWMMTGGTPMTQETSIYCGMFMGFSGNIMEYQRISKSPKATPQYQNISQHCFPPKGRDDYLGVIPAQFWRGKNKSSAGSSCWQCFHGHTCGVYPIFKRIHKFLGGSQRPSFVVKSFKTS